MPCGGWPENLCPLHLALLYEMLKFVIEMQSQEFDIHNASASPLQRDADVEKALTDYREYLLNDTMQYPMNISKIQSSRIETFGNYVCFVQLGAETPEDEEEAILHCQEENEKAIDAIRNALSK